MTVRIRVGDLVMGSFYELPDGSVVELTQVNQTEVRYYCADRAVLLTKPREETETWKLRGDLHDFPNPMDPRLPYEFDLWWDIKHWSDLRRFLESELLARDITTFIEVIKVHELNLEKASGFTATELKDSFHIEL